MLSALRLARVDRPPVWFMRQAGRHLPGYRAIRERAGFLDVCGSEDLNAAVSAEPWRRYGVDAAIVFNDILIPLRDMGIAVEFAPGPRLGRLVALRSEAAALDEPRYDAGTDVARCIRALRAQVGDDAAVLGFVGSPFTIAAFAIAGPSAQRAGGLPEAVRQRRDALEAMQERLAPILVEYARIQADAGADAVQVFESLAGHVDEGLYREIGLPFLLRLLADLKRALPGRPIIAFGRGTWSCAPQIAATGVEALSLDWSQPLAGARDSLRARGLDTALQGNLDSRVLLQTPPRAREAAERLLAGWRSIVPHPDRAAELGPTGWVFNLGHGVPPDASPETVRAVVDAVKGWRGREQPAPNPLTRVGEGASR